MQQSILEPLSQMTQSSLLSFAELFSFMLGEAGRPITRGRVVPPIETSDMLLVFNKSINEVALGYKMLTTIPEIDRDTTSLSRALVSALHLACLLARLLDDETCDQKLKKEILKSMYDLTSLKVCIIHPSVYITYKKYLMKIFFYLLCCCRLKHVLTGQHYI